MDLTDASWRKSSYSDSDSDCVEVAANLPEVIAVRDSKNPTGSYLIFTRAEWARFLTQIRLGPTP